MFVLKDIEKSTDKMTVYYRGLRMVSGFSLTKSLKKVWKFYSEEDALESFAHKHGKFEPMEIE